MKTKKEATEQLKQILNQLGEVTNYVRDNIDDGAMNYTVNRHLKDATDAVAMLMSDIVRGKEK